MGVADELCDELFRWIEKQEQCADHLMDLAKELEKMREVMTTGQLVGNTATVLGSAALIGTGIATILTGGLAAPLLVTAASVTAGVGTVTSLTFTLLENWKSSETMKKAEKTAGQIEKIKNNIESLQKKLLKESESQDFKDLSSDEVQCEITARILRALAKRSGRDLPLSRLIRLLRNDGLYTHGYPGFLLSSGFFTSLYTLLGIFGYSLIFVTKAAAKKGAKYAPLFVTTEGMAALSLKTVLKGTGQVAGGVFGLMFSLPDLVNNCEELIKDKHQTEASRYLRTKANEIRDAVRKLKKQLNELQGMLNEIPETECHIDLATEMCGNQIYTRGTICMEYKQTQKQDSKIQRFIFLSTKDFEESENGSTRKHKSDNKSDQNKRQKPNQTLVSPFSLVQQRRRGYQEKPPQKSSKRVKDFQFRLPTITMSNLRSLPNKIEEIEEMIEDAEYFASDLMFFTETWLNSNSHEISLDGYRSVRVDRDAQLTGKRRGGGLIMFVNEDWASDVNVENIMITSDYELMVVSIRPHGHPQGAPPLIFIHVYVPGPDFKQAAAEIAGFYYDALEIWDGAPVFLLGDFNRCDISPFLSNLEQYVTCPTRYENILDLCYGNVPGAYRCICRPPLGRADHNVIHLIPKNKSDKNDPSKDEKCTHDHTKPREE